MTSAADLIQTQPARPEPAVARKPVVNDPPPENNSIEAAPPQKSFAEHLDEQTQTKTPAPATATNANANANGNAKTPANPSAAQAVEQVVANVAADAKPAPEKSKPWKTAVRTPVTPLVIAVDDSSSEASAQPGKAKAAKAGATAADPAAVQAIIPQAAAPAIKPNAEFLAEGSDAQGAANAAAQAIVPADALIAATVATQPKAVKPGKAGIEKPEAKIETAAPKAAPAAPQVAATTAPVVQVAQAAAAAVAVPAEPAAKPVAEAVVAPVSGSSRQIGENADIAITPTNAETQQANAAKQQVHPAAQNAQANSNPAGAAHAQANAQGSDTAKPDVKIAAATATVDAASALATPAATRETAQSAPAQAALQSAPAAVVQVGTRFIERFDGRAQRFEVRLDPAELGRVDVRIEVGADKKVHAVLAAHDSAALTDLMRGQRSLEQALRDSGIDLADGGIKFELSQDSGRGAANSQSQSDARSNADLAHAWRGFSTVNVAVDSPAAVDTLRPYSSRSSRLDLVA
ncbi:MAG TPA: flagellar hook-length control protein FliK [Hyphomonadaceae bacterium]|nr:flagellar hook-length control protein FliK [Hyphomonadaceae bacterium]